MDVKLFASVFITVLLAEIGDKTQLATLLFASRQDASAWLVFAAASLALALAAGVGVLAGAQLERWVSPPQLKLIAGLGFMGIGLGTLWSR